MKQVIHFTILILVLNLCFLFSPKPAGDTNFCGEYISLNAHAGFIRNCDANEFIESAVSPSALMKENYVRQNRPVYIIAASAIGYSIYGILDLCNATHILNVEQCMYIAYVCLNFFILLLALILFEKIATLLTGGHIPYVVILTLSVFIASNFMTKAFFWTAHQQMMAFLIPLLGIYVSIMFIKDILVKWLYILFFMFGIGMLAYGSFLILYVVCMLYYCFILFEEKQLITFNAAIRIVTATMLFVIPTILWIVFLKYKSNLFCGIFYGVGILCAPAYVYSDANHPLFKYYEW